MDKNLDIHIGATDSVKGPIEAVRHSLGSLIHSFSDAKHGASRLLTGGVALGAGFLGLKAAVDVARGAFHATLGGAIEYQSAISNLHAALTSAGDGSRKATKDAASFADAIERNTTYTRQQVIAAESLGATIGGFTGPALDTATKAAIGLAQKLGIGLRSAMQLVARAAHGQNS